MSTFRGLPEVVHEDSYTDVDGLVYGMDATLKRVSRFTIKEEDHLEIQMGLYNVFQDSDGEQVHAQRLVIEEDGHKDVWIDVYPETLQLVGEWLQSEASKLIPQHGDGGGQ